MSTQTTIEWTESTWNPVTGCTKVSPGCDHCYAETFAERFRGTPGHYFEGGFDVQLRPDKLDLPLRWKRPRKVFVNSMSDLFHDAVPDRYIAQVFAVMGLAPHHTFQVLTKRHGRMRSLLNDEEFVDAVAMAMVDREVQDGVTPTQAGCHWWPLSNIWVGVSAENQQWADIRIPALLDTPAAVRWVSAEPLLGPIDLGYIPNGIRLDGGPRRDCALAEPCRRCGGWGGDPCGVDGPHAVKRAGGIDWVVAGGESGRGARPMHPGWARNLRDQCEAAGVAFLFKQWGEWTPMAPLDKQGRFDFTRSYSLANDGTLYEPGALAYPDGPRYGEAIRADHGRAHLTSMYRVGKKTAGRELDGRTHDGYPAAAA